MKKLLSIAAFFLLLRIGYAQDAVRGSAINGDYVGLEKMTNLSPEDSDAWFHENTLLVRNNEAILDKVPISVRHGKKSYSASDGGFLTYRARFFEKNRRTFVELRLFESDYVIFPVGQDPYNEVKIYPVKLASGQIEINGVRYRRKAVSRKKRERLLSFLSQQSTERK